MNGMGIGERVTGGVITAGLRLKCGRADAGATDGAAGEEKRLDRSFSTDMGAVAVPSAATGGAESSQSMSDSLAAGPFSAASSLGIGFVAVA